MGIDKEFHSLNEISKSLRHHGTVEQEKKFAFVKYVHTMCNRALSVTGRDVKAPSVQELDRLTVSQLRNRLDLAIVVLEEHASLKVSLMTHRQLGNEVARLRRRKGKAEARAQGRDAHLRANLRIYGQRVGARATRTRVTRDMASAHKAAAEAFSQSWGNPYDDLLGVA